jgi:hypothetical protein
MKDEARDHNALLTNHQEEVPLVLVEVLSIGIDTDGRRPIDNFAMLAKKLTWAGRL